MANWGVAEAKARFSAVVELPAQFSLARIGLEDSQAKQVEGNAGEVLKILLDTDVVSQLTENVPNAKAHTWLRGAIDEDILGGCV
jgi:hypothetical protein